MHNNELFIYALLSDSYSFSFSVEKTDQSDLETVHNPYLWLKTASSQAEHVNTPEVDCLVFVLTRMKLPMGVLPHEHQEDQTITGRCV